MESVKIEGSVFKDIFPNTNVDEFIDMTKEYVKESLMAKKEFLTSYWLLTDKHVHMFVVHDMPDIPDVKKGIAEFIRERAKEYSAYCAIFATEAWMVKRKAKDVDKLDTSERPSQAKDRIEVLIITVESKTDVDVYIHEQYRKDDTLTLGKVDKTSSSKADDMHDGVFAHLIE